MLISGAVTSITVVIIADIDRVVVYLTLILLIAVGNSVICFWLSLGTQGEFL
jgi:hypothetical protein